MPLWDDILTPLYIDPGVNISYDILTPLYIDPGVNIS